MTKKNSRENNNDGNNEICAFCGKSASEAENMFSSGEVCICDECVEACNKALENLNKAKGSQEASSEDVFFENEEKFQELLNQRIQEFNTSSFQTKENETFGISSANNLVKEEEDPKKTKPRRDRNSLKKPKEIFSALNEYVVGQESAKKQLAIAVYNHYKRLFLDDSKDDDVEIQKSNVLLLGPTGSGKTLLAQTLAKTLQVPFAIADATTLTEAGYVGDDVENILRKLLISCDWDVEEAQIGIIYIDEIDKIARKGENASITRDVSGEGVQQGLLKIVEGCEATVPPQGGRKHPGQEVVAIDTSNILFILGGAFVGLSDIISKRVGSQGLGFTSEVAKKAEVREAELLEECIPEDLQQYGLIPEFVGRIPVITSLKELEVDDLVHVLTVPKNALIKQYKKLFAIESCNLTFDDDAILAIAKEAKERKTGARGLRAIVERVLSDAMFEVPEMQTPTSIEVKKSDVEGKTKPEIIKKSHSKEKDFSNTKVASHKKAVNE